MKKIIKIIITAFLLIASLYTAISWSRQIFNGLDLVTGSHIETLTKKLKSATSAEIHILKKVFSSNLLTGDAVESGGWTSISSTSGVSYVLDNENIGLAGTLNFTQLLVSPPANAAVLIPAKQVKIQLNGISEDAIELRTTTGNTASIIARTVTIPQDAIGFSFCYLFPKADKHLFEVQFVDDSVDTSLVKHPESGLWSMTGNFFTKEGYTDFDDYKKKEMNRQVVIFPGRQAGRTGTVYLVLYNSGEGAAKVIFSQFQFLFEDYKKMLNAKNANFDVIDSCISLE